MYFNPRPPCGDRPEPPPVRAIFALFQSTTPVRGSTASTTKGLDLICYFNPRPPCGDRLCLRPPLICGIIFQSTTPVRGSTASDFRGAQVYLNFNPRPPCGDRQQKFIKLTAQPTAKAAIPPITFCHRQRGMPFRS